jgi:hypothetical protein
MRTSGRRISAAPTVGPRPELGGAGLDGVGELERGAVARYGLRPAGERAVGRGGGPGDLVGRRLGDPCDDLAGGRIEDVLGRGGCGRTGPRYRGRASTREDTA